MTKRHRKAGMEPIIHQKETNGVKWKIDQTLIDNAKELHGLDLVKEVENFIANDPVIQAQVRKENNE